MHLKSFLVPEAQFENAKRAISRRNFFGDWMPKNARWLHVFVCEYPWASACNVETDDWLGLDTTVREANIEFIPVFNEVVCEWEYDSTLPSTICFHVPTRTFFKAGPLWWDSLDGFATLEGKTVFRDPSASEGGPSALLADVDEILLQLDKLGYRLLWTFLGEKYILGDPSGDTPRVTYSQSAFLNKDGTITVGKRVFFDDYDKDQGLAI
jgi:hypothetical protein